MMMRAFPLLLLCACELSTTSFLVESKQICALDAECPSGERCFDGICAERGSAQAASSTLSVDRTDVPADGVETATVTLTLIDAAGNKAADANVHLSQ